MFNHVPIWTALRAAENEIYCVVAYFSTTGAVGFHGRGRALDRLRS